MYQLTYIYHDCFILETDKAVLLFDYWKDPLAEKGDKDYPPLLKELKSPVNTLSGPVYKPVYIIISHHHKDHFSRRVFLWQKEIPCLQYIISPDVFKSVEYIFKESGTYKGRRPTPSSVHVLKRGESFGDERLKITAFGSTDIGNSYAVEVDGYRFFHAGDLNAWLWADESPSDEIEEAKKNYIDIVSEIKEKFKSFDLVMFPVDSRLGTQYWWGARYFVSEILSSVFVPMHFELVFDEEDKLVRRLDAGAFRKYARKDYGEYVHLVGTRSALLKT